MKTTVLVLLVLGLSAAASANEAQKPTTEEAKKARDTKSSYLKKANRELDEWSTKVQNLEARSQASGSNVRQRLDVEIAKMKERVSAARQGIQDIAASGEGALGSLRRNLDQTFRELRLDYRNAISHFKKEDK